MKFTPERLRHLYAIVRSAYLQLSQMESSTLEFALRFAKHGEHIRQYFG